MATPEIYWNNLFNAATLSATTEAADRPASKASDFDLGTFWKSNTTGAGEYIQADWPASEVQTADALVIDGHQFDGVDLALVKASSSNFFDAATIDDWTSTASIQLRRFAANTFRSLRIIAPSAVSTPHCISEMFVGERLTLDRNPRRGFDPHEEISKNVNNETESGREVTIHRFRRRMVRARMTNVNSATYGALREMWQNHSGLSRPFWWSFRPATEPEETFMAKVADDRFRWPHTPFRRDGVLNFRQVI